MLEPNPKLRSPADLYLEGSDQHRGWFHSSLLESVGTRGVAPYKSVLTHGFVLDGQGRKMSKSVGNVVAPEDVIKKFGADILRLWCAAQDYRDDTRISQEILTRVAEAYRRIRNTCRYILGNISDFDPATETVAFGDMPEIDRWALHQLELLKERVLDRLSGAGVPRHLPGDQRLLHNRDERLLSRHPQGPHVHQQG